MTPSSVQIQFPGITGGNLMYVDERLFRQAAASHAASAAMAAAGSHPAAAGAAGSGQQQQAKDTAPWENAIILEGNKIFTLTGLKAGITYRLRWQAPDRQYQDVMVTTKGDLFFILLRIYLLGSACMILTSTTPFHFSL